MGMKKSFAIVIGVVVAFAALGITVFASSNNVAVSEKTTLGDTLSENTSGANPKAGESGENKPLYIPHPPINIIGNSDFTASNGVVNPWAAGTQTDPYIIEGWEIDGGLYYGIQVTDTDAYFIIKNCYMHDNAKEGIYLRNVSNSRVENCNVTKNGGSGVYIVGTTVFSFTENNIIYGNEISRNSWHGVVLEGSYGPCRNLSILDNIIDSNGGVGIVLSTSWNNTVAYNVVSNNSIGVKIKRCTNTKVTGNAISLGATAGIKIDECKNVSILDNSILSCCVGIFVCNCSAESMIYNNEISHNTDAGILLTSSFDALISNNNISNNGNGIVTTNSSCNITTFRNEVVSFGGYYWPPHDSSEYYLRNFTTSSPTLRIELILNDPNTDLDICVHYDTDGSGTFNATQDACIGWGGQPTGMNEFVLLTNLQPGLYFIIVNEFEGPPTTTFDLTIYEEGNAVKPKIVNNKISSNARAGVRVYNTSCIINSNELSNNLYGIWLELSSQSTILLNNITHNTLYGVYLSASNLNFIHHNNLINNNAGGVQAYDNTGTNFWNTSGIPHGYGNYWSDWLTPDANNDGIVDYPYLIDGGAGARDYYPLVGQVQIPAFPLPLLIIVFVTLLFFVLRKNE